MIEAALVSTPGGCTNKIPSVSTKNPSASKSLRQFTDTLDIKHKTAVQRFGVAKLKQKEIKRQCVTAKHCK